MGFKEYIFRGCWSFVEWMVCMFRFEFKSVIVGWVGILVEVILLVVKSRTVVSILFIASVFGDWLRNICFRMRKCLVFVLFATLVNGNRVSWNWK